MKPAFYLETTISMECAGPVGVFSQFHAAAECPASRHLSSEIDFFPDTLESSHAYIRPVVVSSIVSRRLALTARLEDSRKESPVW